MRDMTIQEAAALGQGIQNQMQNVLVGRDEAIKRVICTLFAGGHALMEDVPGTGKTLLARSLAACVRLTFKRVQFTPDLLPGDVTGSSVYRPREERFVFVPGPIFAGILLADEINRATPRTQSALLEAMEEKQVTADGETRTLPDVFMVIATQNPVESTGTFPLPEAQLDRFLMRLTPGYPSYDEEIAMLARFAHGDPLADVSPVADGEQLLAAQRLARTVEATDDLLAYIARIVDATREQEGVLLGASPRAALARLRASQALAMLEGRAYVIPDDVQRLSSDVLSHRLLTSAGAWERGADREAVRRAVESVKVPVEAD